MRFEVRHKEVWRLSPHGDRMIADCYTEAWAREIAKLLNEEDRK